MKRNVEKYDYQVLNDAKNILMEIDMPKELYNPRCVMIFCACAQMVNYLSHAVQKFLWKWLLTVVTITHL